GLLRRRVVVRLRAAGRRNKKPRTSGAHRDSQVSAQPAHSSPRARHPPDSYKNSMWNRRRRPRLRRAVSKMPQVPQLIAAAVNLYEGSTAEGKTPHNIPIKAAPLLLSKK